MTLTYLKSNDRILHLLPHAQQTQKMINKINIKRHKLLPNWWKSINYIHNPHHKMLRSIQTIKRFKKGVLEWHLQHGHCIYGAWVACARPQASPMGSLFLVLASHSSLSFPLGLGSSLLFLIIYLLYFFLEHQWKINTVAKFSHVVLHLIFIVISL